MPCPWDMFPSKPVVARPGTAEALRQALGWIRECTGCHKCGVVCPTRLPARLVEVGSFDNDIRLEEPKEIKDRYFCLSYCHEKNHLYKNTEKNLKDYLVSINWSKIPKTFQDAISLTRNLGIAYIWIDVLYVVQDNEDEKFQQYQEMGQIFGNAFLVIAATSSKDSSSGLYSGHHFCVTII